MTMSFKGLNLSEKMITCLNKAGYYSPSDVQLRVIPKALKGETLCVQSATGTGKTHAFLIPIIERLDLSKNEVQAVIISPTRELARQTFKFASYFEEHFKGLKTKLLVSGSSLDSSVEGLKEAPHIIIATPKRLIDVINENILSLKNVKTLVLDEADMLLKEGFMDEVKTIRDELNNDLQYLVFSATLENNIKNELMDYIGSNKEIINEDVLTNSNVKHYLIDIKSYSIFEATKLFIEKKNPYLLIVFASKKETVNALHSYLLKEGIKAGLLTGDLSSRERKNVMKSLLNDHYHILIASDVASRGLDIDDVTDVLSVDLAPNKEFYYHRAGRTGRFLKDGNSFVFYNNDNVKRVLLLLEDGVPFSYLQIKNGEIIEGKPLERTHPTRRKKDDELEREINKVRNQAIGKNKKIKPGYKKKVKQEIDKVKKKHRRELIKKEIRKERVERYKRESKKYE